MQAILDRPGGAQVSYEIAGPAGAPVVVACMNGSLLNRRQWDLLLARLPRVVDSPCRIILQEYRGFGEAKSLNEPLRFSDVIADASAVFDAVGITVPVILVGASLGSLVGLAMAARAPSRIAGLVTWGLVSPVPAVMNHVSNIMASMKKTLDAVDFFTNHREERLDEKNVDPVIAATWDTFVVNHSATPEAIKARGPSAGYRSYILKHVAGTPVDSLGSFLSFAGSKDLEALARDFDVDTPVASKITALHGSADLVAPFVEARTFCNDHDIEFIQVERKGHADHVIDREACDAIARAVQAVATEPR